jgi:O-antigen ligase
MFNKFPKLSNDLYFLDIFLYLIPISILLGTLILNVFTAIISSIFIFLIITKKISVNIKYINLIYLIFFSFIFINNINSINIGVTLKSSINLIKSFFVILALYYCLNKSEEFKKNFFSILFFVYLFVLLDTYIQHFFEKDLFGFEVSYSNGRRLSGPFDNEYIVGAYLSKLFFLTSLFLIIFKQGKYFYILMSLSFPLVILSNERSASIMLLSGLIIYFLFCNINFKKKFFAFVAILVFLVSIFYSNENLKNHFISVPIKYFKDNHHKAHFLASIEIFKDHPLSGTGIRTFRIECKKEKYALIKTKYYNKRCTTHPHNIYLEILSETGIIGFAIILVLNLYVLVSLIKFFFKEKDQNLKWQLLLVFCNFFILFWPLQTTGAIFSSYNSIFYVLFYGVFFELKKNFNY